MTDLDPQETSNPVVELGRPAKAKRQKRERNPYAEQPVLRTESADDLAWLHAEFSKDIRPRNFIERMYVGDMVRHTWNILRYARIQTGLLNNAQRRALVSILRQIQFPPSSIVLVPVEITMAPRDLAYQWLFDREIKRSISAMLREAGTDESAIEAEAYRLAAADLEGVNRALNDAEKARNRALRSIAKYRKRFAEDLRASSDRVIAADDVRNDAITVN